jgi:hypothetical protein
MLARFLDSVELLIVVSAALIVCIVMPYVFLTHWHLLPSWEGFAVIYLLFPVVIAWNHAGIFFLLIIVVREVMVPKLKPAVRRTTIALVARISVCVLAQLFLTIGNRFNFH